jgi:hypothetical protein
MTVGKLGDPRRLASSKDRALLTMAIGTLFAYPALCVTGIYLALVCLPSRRSPIWG